MHKPVHRILDIVGFQPEWLLVKLNVKHRIPAAWRSRVRGWITGVRADEAKPGEFQVTDRNVEDSLYIVALARRGGSA